MAKIRTNMNLSTANNIVYNKNKNIKNTNKRDMYAN